MEFENNVDGFRFSSHGDELPAKTLNFEDMVTPIVKSKAKKQQQKKESEACDPSAPVQNDSEEIRAVRKRRSEDKTKKKARVHGRRMRRKKVKRSAPAYPSTVCPISVRDVGSGSSDEQVKALLSNICENELKYLRKAFEDHPFLVEAMTKSLDGFADRAHKRLKDEMQTPKKQVQQHNEDGLRVNPKNIRLRQKRDQIKKLMQQYRNEVAAWESAKENTMQHLKQFTADEESSSETPLEHEQKEFLAGELQTSTAQSMLQHAKNISLQADCIERAVVAADNFASEYKRGHSQLVEAFQAQTRSTYGDVSNAKQIVSQLIRA